MREKKRLKHTPRDVINPSSKIELKHSKKLPLATYLCTHTRYSKLHENNSFFIIYFCKEYFIFAKGEDEKL